MDKCYWLECESEGTTMTQNGIWWCGIHGARMVGQENINKKINDKQKELLANGIKNNSFRMSYEMIKFAKDILGQKPKISYKLELHGCETQGFGFLKKHIRAFISVIAWCFVF